MTDVTPTEFLRAVMPAAGCLTIVAINPLGKECFGRSVNAKNPGRADAFIEKYRGKQYNLYWSVNPTDKFVDKKPDKTDIESVGWLHVDIDDPSPEALDRLRNYRVPPTLIIFSGGGYQGFWKLREPQHANGNAERLEAYNQLLIRDLGGDKGTWNIDRVMRLPGTTNYPTATKLKKGRVPIDASLLEAHARIYDLGDFGEAAPAADAALKDVPKAGAPAPEKSIDRSAELLAKAGKRVRAGMKDPDIHKELADDPHARDQADPWRAIQNAIDVARKDQSEAVELINKEHALIFIEGKLGVMWKGEWTGGLPRMSSIEDMRTFWRNKGVRKSNPINEWLDSPGRDEYIDIVYEPGVLDVGRSFNLFTGYGVEPRSGDCHLIRAHIREVLCKQDASLSDYVIQWLANIVQTPRNKPGTTIVIKSGQGAGKGRFANYLGSMLGRNYLALNHSAQLLTQFNDHLAGKLLVFADEVVWPNDHRGVKKFQSYITEPTIFVERKFVPGFTVPNYARFIVVTNEEYAAPADIDDRRYVVLEASDQHRDDFDYWNALEAERLSGGPAALLHYLLNEVKITVQLRRNPKTDALGHQKLLGLDDVGRFWRDMLMSHCHVLKEGYREEVANVAAFDFGNVVATKTLHLFYQDFAAKNKIAYPASLDSLGIRLRKYLPILTKREARVEETKRLNLEPRKFVYELPWLPDARRAFEQAIGHSVEWPEYTGPAKPADVNDDL
ncbi:MAG: DUF5906 domain-containing protein [Steroidobacteraceae bacterium]